MATLTRNTIRAGAATFDRLSLPTATQQRAFEFLGAPIPLTPGTQNNPARNREPPALQGVHQSQAT